VASAAEGGRVLDMVPVGVQSTVGTVAATWASGAEEAGVVEVAPVPAAVIAASEVVLSGTSRLRRRRWWVTKHRRRYVCSQRRERRCLGRWRHRLYLGRWSKPALV